MLIMELIKTVFSPWTQTYNFNVQNDEFEPVSNQHIKEYFVVYGDNGKPKENKRNIIISKSTYDTRIFYMSYYDYQTGYIRKFCCPPGMFFRGILYIIGSLARPVIVFGAEITDAILTFDLNLIDRITKVVRAVLYWIPMVACSLGMLLLPWSYDFALKLTELEYAANRGVACKESMRVAEDRGKLAVYITDGFQPVGHIADRVPIGQSTSPVVDEQLVTERSKFQLKRTFEHDHSVGKHRFRLSFKLTTAKPQDADLTLDGLNYKLKLWGRDLSLCKADKTLKKEICVALKALCELRAAADENKHRDKLLKEISDQGIFYRCKNNSSYVQLNTLVPEDQKHRLKDASFIDTTKIKTIEDIYYAVKDQITRLP